MWGRLELWCWVQRLPDGTLALYRPDREHFRPIRWWHPIDLIRYLLHEALAAEFF